jgi:hypothetical protein
MISFKNNIKKSALSFKVIVVCLLLSGSLIIPSYANGTPVLTNGRYNCNTGVLEVNQLVPTGYFTITNDVVTGNTACTGAVIIPNGVTSIGNDAFYFATANTALTSVTIPNSVTSIGINAFYNNSALTSVIIPNSVTSIGGYAFFGTALTSVTIPNSVLSIDSAAFESNTRLASVTIGNSVITIGDNAFKNNTLLTSVTIGNSVTSIGTSAFQGNTALTSVTIPDSVTSIGTYAFYVTGLTSVTFSGTPNLTSIGQGVLSNTALTSIIIPNSVTSIGEGAFYFDTELTSVTIGNSVTSIADNAFGASTKLTSVEFLGDAPPTVGVNVFSGVAVGAIANVAYNATGFGSTWNGLIVRYASAPAVDSGSSSPNTVVTIAPAVVKTAAGVFNLKNKRYLSKNDIKTKLSKNRSFKRNPEDLYKYSIFKTSKKTCILRGNYVMALKKTGSCNLYATRTTPKGAKYKYWVKINYSN